jgi:hypothetical protein
MGSSQLGFLVPRVPCFRLSEALASRMPIAGEPAKASRAAMTCQPQKKSLQTAAFIRASFFNAERWQS